LLKDNTLAGNNVFDSRIIAWDEKKLPAISVSTPSQNGNASLATQVPVFETVVTVEIEVTTVVNDRDWAEKLDNLCEQVENVLLRNINFTSNPDVNYSYIQSYNTNMKYYDGGELPIASAVIELSFNVNRIDFEPIILDDFLTLGVKSKNIKMEINLEASCERLEKTE
jgi:hypothetical protein